MAVRYTDVDQMIFKRWDEVKALQGAFEELVDRMQDVVEASLQRVATDASEQGWTADCNEKRPSIWFWKREWQNKRQEPAIYFEIFDFVPEDYGKDVGACPSVWFMTDEFSRLKVRESSEEFGKALRAALSPELLKKWAHADADISDSPVGLDLEKVTEADRLRLAADPDALSAFIKEHLAEAVSELGPAIDQALQKMTPK